VVHEDTSAYIALVDESTDWQHGSAQCLLGRDISEYDFLSITKEGFVPISVQSTSKSQLGVVGFQ
jgi:hypothetical protein